MSEQKEKSIEKLWRQELGSPFARIIDLMNAIREILLPLGVGPAIIEWLVTDGRTALKEACESLAKDYLLWRAYQLEGAPMKLKLRPWKKIRLGAHSDCRLFDAVCDLNGTSQWTKSLKEIISRQLCVSKQAEVSQLVKIPLKEIGIKEPLFAKDFLNSAFLDEWSKKHLDGYVLELLTIEEVFLLRLQLIAVESFDARILYMAMSQLSERAPYVFSISEGSNLLELQSVSNEFRWGPDSVFVFKYRKL